MSGTKPPRASPGFTGRLNCGGVGRGGIPGGQLGPTGQFLITRSVTTRKPPPLRRLTVRPGILQQARQTATRPAAVPFEVPGATAGPGRCPGGHIDAAVLGYPFLGAGPHGPQEFRTCLTVTNVDKPSLRCGEGPS